MTVSTKPVLPTVDQLLFGTDVVGLAAAEAEYRQAAVDATRAADRIRAIITTATPAAAPRPAPAPAPPPAVAPPTPEQLAAVRAQAEAERRRKVHEQVERIVRKVRGKGRYQPGECFREACFHLALVSSCSARELARRAARPETSMYNPLKKFEGVVFRRTRHGLWELIPGVGEEAKR